MSGPQSPTGELVRIEREGRHVNYIYTCLHCGEEFSSKLKRSKFCGMECSRAYFKSRPRERMCVECGTVFRILIKGKVYSERKTCSDECAEIQRRDHIDYASPERSRKLSKAHKRLGSIANLHTPEVRAKAGPAIGDAKAWVYRTGKSALGVPRSSRVIYLMSPHGEVFRTQVIRQFVRDHEELFSAADLARRKANKKNRTTIEGNMTCKAMNGLGEVAREVKRSWKGWTKVKETE